MKTLSHRIPFRIRIPTKFPILEMTKRPVVLSVKPKNEPTLEMKAKKRKKKKEHKIQPGPYEPPSEKQMAAWERQRRRRDGVPDLEEGFTICGGRAGMIYYREGDKILELYWEYSGVDERGLLLGARGLKQWFYPVIEPIPPDKQAQLKEAVITMVRARGGTAIFEDPILTNSVSELHSNQGPLSDKV
ncbi:MAG: hypothetical protein ABIY63_19080 [Fibrobacteria bacterium]